MARLVEVVERGNQWFVRIMRDEQAYITEDLGSREEAVLQAESQAPGQPIKVVHEQEPEELEIEMEGSE